MRLSITLCVFALLMGCDGDKTATSTASGAESSANEPTQRLSAAGESCGRTADCEEGLRCLEQKCTAPKEAEPSGDVKAQYMALVCPSISARLSWREELRVRRVESVRLTCV